MKVFDIAEYKCGGYPKAGANLQKLINAGHDELVVTDLNLTEEQFLLALESFDKVYYFDHHIESEKLEKYAIGNDKVEYHYSSKMSATAIVYNYWRENDGKSTAELSRLAMLTDIYDMWRIDHELFSEAYKLNDLFWKYSFFGFLPKFKNGFYGFSAEEELWLAEQISKRKAIIEDSPQEAIGNNAHVILLDGRDALADVQFVLPGEVFYIISRSGDQYCGSIRIKSEKEHFNINDGLKTLLNNFPDIIITGGGHKHAGGCSFNKDMKINDVLDFVRKNMDPIINPEFEKSY